LRSRARAIEVTEDILLHDGSRVLDMFKRIQQLGVRILFDDFGPAMQACRPPDARRRIREAVFGRKARSCQRGLNALAFGLAPARNRYTK
jgi:hypothetical protein